MKKVYYNNGVHEKRFLPDEDIPEGWQKGRLKSCVTTKGYIWVNNGIESKFISPDTSIPEGYVLGRINAGFDTEEAKQNRKSKKYHYYNDGHKDYLISEYDDVPDNLIKGRCKMSDEQKIKLSKSHTGIKHTEETKLKISKHSNNNRQKAYDTIIKTYGSLDNFYSYIHQKGNDTKVINHTFNVSKPETQLYRYLCEIYGKQDVLRHYKCEKYPFYCDFYIKSKDLFIELNKHWTHGSKPYNKEDSDCEQQLLIWKEKAKTSQYYVNAINTWTVRDVNKLHTAQENNLNYIVIY